jgi:lipoprotein-releasing system ATP-binding protein
VLINLVRLKGLAALVATHNLDLAARMDRALILHEGRLVEERSLADGLSSRPRD